MSDDCSNLYLSLNVIDISLKSILEHPGVSCPYASKLSKRKWNHNKRLRRKKCSKQEDGCPCQKKNCVCVGAMIRKTVRCSEYACDRHLGRTGNFSRYRLEHIGKENCKCYYLVLLLCSWFGNRMTAGNGIISWRSRTRPMQLTPYFL